MSSQGVNIVKIISNFWTPLSVFNCKTTFPKAYNLEKTGAGSSRLD
jgi:hypothetical protein